MERRTARSVGSIAGRFAVGLALVGLAVAYVVLVSLSPIVLAATAGAAAVGAMGRWLWRLRRPEQRVAVAAARTMEKAVLGVEQHEGAPPARRRRHAPRASPARHLERRSVGSRWVAAGIVAALLAVVALALTFSVDVALHVEQDPSTGDKGAYELAYRAQLAFEEGGDWVGEERFTLTRADARAVLRAGRGPLGRRLAAAAPTGWRVDTVRGGEGVRWLIRRPYPSDPFRVPRLLPIKTTTTIAIADLDAPGLRYRLVAAERSLLTLSAPEHRVAATTPPSTPVAEAGGRQRRTVTLETAGADVTVDVESDLARRLDQRWVADGVPGVLYGVMGVLGFSLAASFRWLKKLWRWLRHGPTRVTGEGGARPPSRRL